MDTTTFFLLQLLDDEENSLEDEDLYERTTALASLLLAGSLLDGAAQTDRRRAHRAYLCRPQLLPNPRHATPWSALYESGVDRAFVVTMGVDVRAFRLILSSGFAVRWDHFVIPRQDASGHAAPRPERRSLDAAGALGLVLHYLNSTMRELSLQQIFALIPSTVTRYIDFAMNILLETLCTMPEGVIRWPDEDELERYTGMVQERHSLLVGAFATIDGLNPPCQTSNDVEIENATYNGWQHDHFISQVIVFAPDGTIIAARINCPGSWHDSRVAKPIYIKLREDTPLGYYLVADTAFPRGTQQIEGRIRAPMKSGQALPHDTVERAKVLAFDRQLVVYRQTAEWGMRALQGSFGRLRIPLDINHDHRRANLLETCLRLHNVRTRVVGINQIRTVYQPLWSQGEQSDVWHGFKDMVFGEQRRRDRVAQFHNVVHEA